MMLDIHGHPWHLFLHQVISPSRYIGGEFGTVVKNDDSLASMALVFPDVYEVGMSHLGSQILYYVCNAEPDLRVERCFAPWPDLERQLRERGLPLVTLETFTPLRKFDVIGFSLQHELSYTNVLNVLDLAKIPLYAEERDDATPLVIAGGPCAMRPEPMAPFIDAFFAGEAELALPLLLRTVARMRRGGAKRHEVIQTLAKMPGIYCPSLYRQYYDPASGYLVSRPITQDLPGRIARVYLADLDSCPSLRVWVPWGRAVFDRISIEPSRGCSEGCRFCEAGYTYRPLRDRSPNRLLNDVVSMVEATGYEEVSLGGLSPADHPALGQLVKGLTAALAPRGVTLTLSSLRAYGVSEEVLHEMKKVRATGLTLAPEAGTQRLRNFINKNITDEDLLNACCRAFAGNWQKVKLYFMLGLPTEQDEDIVEIVKLVRRVKDMACEMGVRARITASVGVFVPRPHTPLQWEGMAEAKLIEERQGLLRRTARRMGIEVKYQDLWTARLEGVLSRGDRRVADTIEAAFRLGGRFDNWAELARPELWDRVFEQTGVDPDHYLRPLPLDAGLPWDVIDPLVTRDFLLRERDRAYAGITLPPCEKPVLRPSQNDYTKAERLVCYRCGVGCDPVELASKRRSTVLEASALSVRASLSESEPRMYHIRYTKMGRAAWLSQRDIVRHMPRILRRAGILPVLTGGFHPTPRITYCQPIPVGYRSVGEWLDVLAIGDPLLERLNAASVDGITFISIEETSHKRRDVIRFAFASPILSKEQCDRLAPAKVTPISHAEIPLLDSIPKGPVFVLEWPGKHPLGRPHEALTTLTGQTCTPYDFVRLYGAVYCDKSPTQKEDKCA